MNITKLSSKWLYFIICIDRFKYYFVKLNIHHKYYLHVIIINLHKYFLLVYVYKGSIEFPKKEDLSSKIKEI